MSRKNIIFLSLIVLVVFLLVGGGFYINKKNGIKQRDTGLVSQEQKDKTSVETIFKKQEEEIKKEEAKIQKISDETEINPEEDDAKTIVEKLDKLNKEVDDILE